jgi:hypothetical protein
MPYRPERWCGAKVMLDANTINARQADADLNQIEAWRASGAILQLMAEPAYEEARAGGDSKRESKADKQLLGISHHDSTEQHIWNAIESAVFPGGATSAGERNDVEIVFQAAAWGYVLVTNDGASRRQPRGILGARDDLATLGVTVMKPREFVIATRERLAKRDERIQRVCTGMGMPLPDWLGKD